MLTRTSPMEEASRLRDGEDHHVTLAGICEKRTDEKPFNTFAKFAVAAMDLDGPIVKDIAKWKGVVVLPSSLFLAGRG